MLYGGAESEKQEYRKYFLILTPLIKSSPDFHNLFNGSASTSSVPQNIKTGISTESFMISDPGFIKKSRPLRISLYFVLNRFPETKIRFLTHSDHSSIVADFTGSM
jgi:hypothetical protein